MVTEPFRIAGPWPGRLAISARPRGGDWLPDEIRAWLRAGIDTVVSLLTATEADCGRPVSVHCRQGIGRSSLVAAGLLIERGLHPDEALRRIEAARHTRVPETREQRSWIDSFAAAVGQRR